jgi:alpha-L-arabinofuranosidase
MASGPNTDDWNWTREFLAEILRKGPGELRRIYGMALHCYAWNLSRGKTHGWEAGKGDALKFDAVDWYALLREGERMEFTGHWQVLSEFDHDHRVQLIMNESGPWYRPGTEATPSDLLEQMPTLPDAVFSGMTLNIFNRHREKIAMANCAQLITCLNRLYLAYEDKFVVTPVGHVFDLYSNHRSTSNCISACVLGGNNQRRTAPIPPLTPQTFVPFEKRPESSQIEIPGLNNSR